MTFAIQSISILEIALAWTTIINTPTPYPPHSVYANTKVPLRTLIPCAAQYFDKTPNTKQPSRDNNIVRHGCSSRLKAVTGIGQRTKIKCFYYLCRLK